MTNAAVRVTRTRERIAIHEYLQANGTWHPCKRRGFCRECNRRAPPRRRPAFSFEESRRMKAEPVRARVVACIRRSLAIVPGEAPEITDASRFAGDLSADSLDQLDILMEVEDEFAIEISDAQAVDFKTVGDLVAHVEQRVAPTTSSGAAG